MAAASAGEKKKRSFGRPFLPPPEGIDVEEAAAAVCSGCLLCRLLDHEVQARRDISVHCSQAKRRDDGRAGQCGRVFAVSWAAQTCRRADSFGARTVENSVPGKIDSVRASGRSLQKQRKKRLFLEICLRKRRLCNCTVEEVCKQYYRGAAWLLARGWMSSVFSLFAVCVIHPTG